MTDELCAAETTDRPTADPLLYPVWVRLVDVTADPCTACGHVEPCIVMRLQDDRGRQYNVSGDPIPSDWHGPVVGTWTPPDGWRLPPRAEIREPRA